MQGETSDARVDKPCDICGHVGYEELIMTCSKCCTAREHFYCTRGRAREVPEVWICEACLSSSAIVSPQSGGEKELDPLGMADHDVMHPGTPGDAYSDSGWQVCSKKPKMEIGKVKFLPTQEVISLSSGTVNMVSPRRNNPGLKYRLSSSIVPMSRRTSIPSKIVTPKFSVPREKANPNVMSSGFVKPLTHGGAEISTIGRHEVKTSKQSKEDCGGKQQQRTIYMPAKENKKLKAQTKIVKVANINSEDAINRVSYASSTSVHSTTSKGIESSNRKMEKAMNNTSPLMVSPITSSGQTFHVVSEPDNVAVDERDLLNILTKLEPYRRYLPALEDTWKGSFEFLDTASVGAFHGCFQARPPCRVRHKVFEFSKKLSSILQVNLFPRSHLWADLFGNDCPDFHDIALYFFPAANIERSKRNFTCLFELLEIQNSVMRSYIDGVELLIFTSKQLHVDCQRIVARLYTENFLWGIFRHVKSDILHESSELPSLVSTVECAFDDHVSMDNVEAMDMDIDMEGGRIVGPIDVVSKELSGRACGSHNKGDVNSATEKMLLEPRMRQYTSSKLVSKSLENKCKINSEHPSEILKGKLVNAKDDSAFPPGFKERPSLNSRNIKNKVGVFDGVVINPGKKENAGLQGVSGAAFGASSQPTQRSSEHFKLASQNQHQEPTRDQGYDPSAAFTPLLSMKDNRRGLKIKAEGNDDQNLHRTWKKDLEVEAKRKMNTSVCWRPPPKNWVKLNIEGSSSGVLGSAGAGGIVRDESGKWLLGYSKNLGTGNSLASELWALYHGLQLVWERGFRKVLVESVSHEAMKCLEQPTAYLDANRDLIQSCRDLLHRNWDCKFQHINHEANLCANWLATHCDLRPLGSLSLFNTPPCPLVPIFQNDSTGIVQSRSRQSPSCFPDKLKQLKI